MKFEYLGKESNMDKVRYSMGDLSNTILEPPEKIAGKIRMLGHGDSLEIPDRILRLKLGTHDLSPLFTEGIQSEVHGNVRNQNYDLYVAFVDVVKKFLQT